MSFYLPQWTQLGSRIDEVKLRIRSEEQRVFATLRDKVIANLVTLRRNAAVLDELDVSGSFAVLAREQRLVRPALDAGVATRIVAGRHPTVEAGLRARGRGFTANDCSVGEGGGGEDDARILLITGPNMGGKSTFLRQAALITILAQTGGYVPAAHARLGIADAVFSRMGSADDVARDRSTFLVEMLETAAILRGATARSLVVMDEVGRGTTAADGLAVGFAALAHLARRNRCRALFATHFHALADMTAGWGCVARLCTDVVVEKGGGFYFSHKMREGVSRESHALKVAALAGMPEEAIAVAREVLEKLRAGEDVGRLPMGGVGELAAVDVEASPAKSAGSQ
jgi:DNA mismatch repair ATPase MutS